MANGQADLQAQMDAMRQNVTGIAQRQQAAIDAAVAAYAASDDAEFERQASALKEMNSQLTNSGTQVQPATTRQDVNVPTSGGSGIGPTSAPLPNTAGPSRETLSDQPAEGPAPADAQSRGPNDEPL